MKMKEYRIGFAMTGSYCTFANVFKALESLKAEFPDITPIMSENVFNTDSRFGTSEEFKNRLEEMCGKKIISTITAAEPIGPKGLLDLLIIATCTGNTIAKMANGITDSAVTMAAKAHLRNGRPVLLAISTNDGLSANAGNIGSLMNRKNIYFVPFGQDDCMNKPTSLTAKFEFITEAAKAALEGKQLQPIIS